MNGSAKVLGICWIVIGGLLAALLYHSFVESVLGYGYPSNTFLYMPETENFTDFTFIFNGIRSGSPLGWAGAVYFPFAYIPLYPLIWMSSDAAFATMLVSFSALTFYFFWRRLEVVTTTQRTVAAIILTFTTYPFLFCLTRGNIEMIVFLFLLGFLASIQRGRYLLAGIFLALATAMKIYPGVFGVLLLYKRQWSASALTAALTLALTLGAAAAFPGGIPGTLDLLSNNLEFFKNEYVLNPDKAFFSASYFSVLKLAGRVVGGDVTLLAQRALIPYTVACILLFACITVYVLRYERVLWKQAALLAFTMILLPEVSFDYKLIHLFIPIGLFLAAPPGNPQHDRLYMLLFGLLLIPKAYAPLGSETTIGVVLNPLLMTLMMAHIVWSGIVRRRTPFEDTDSCAAKGDWHNGAALSRSAV